MGMRSSPLPSNSQVVRRADVEDPDRKAFLQAFVKGMAMGHEFAEQNPRAATEIVFKTLIGIELAPAGAGVVKDSIASRLVIHLGVAGGTGVAADAAIGGGLAVVKLHPGPAWLPYEQSSADGPHCKG